MKKFFFALLALSSMSFLMSCGDDDPVVETVFDYQAQIGAPSTDAKHIGGTLPISVTFESKTGETVHHVKVRIYNKDDNTEIYSGPSDAHVHEMSGKFEYTDNIDITMANGFMPHSDWVLEAKVWGHDAGMEEIVETLEFHVHPTNFSYKAQINSPSVDDKKVGDQIDINIDFNSETQETVHHVKVRIYNKADDSIVIYEQPDDAHVHQTDGNFKFEDTFTLSENNGVNAHSDWILEAKVWGHHGGDGEVVETIEFHVHPQ